MQPACWSMYFKSADQVAERAIARVLSFLEAESAVVEEVVMVNPADFHDVLSIDTLIDEPKLYLKVMACAHSELLFNKTGETRKITIKITRIDLLTSIAEIRAENLSRFISVAGTVARVENVAPYLKSLSFLCTKCGCETVVRCKRGCVRYPTKCFQIGCKGKRFSLAVQGENTMFIDSQRIVIQDAFAGLRSDGGVPRVVSCVLFGSDVDSVSLGDSVVVRGIVKARTENQLQTLYIHVYGVTNSSLQSMVQPIDRDSAILLNKKSNGTILETLSHSLAPAIYGHFDARIGLVLSLLGGTRSEHRSDIHVLLIGDPGIGKSQLLCAASELLPRSVYVCATSCTTTGLTVSVHHDANTNDYALDAGALLLADQGCCCIDEFSKIKDFKCLYEAMEQQSVSVAKAGIVATLPCRTAIIAAMNPSGGSFKANKETLLPNEIRSRFDLIFTLKDEGCDQERIQHLQRYRKREVEETSRYTMTQEELRQYLLYARTLAPVLSSSASKVLFDFYIEERKRADVTIRLLESLVRLVQAKAKSDLRTTASTGDASYIIELYRRSIQVHKKTAKTKRLSAPMELYKVLEENCHSGRLEYTNNELREMISKLKGAVESPSMIIDKLNCSGIILKTKNGYKFNPAGC